MDLTKLQNDTMSQMLGNENITESFTPKLKGKLLKVGIVSALAVTAFCSSGMAHAGTKGQKALNSMLGVSTLTGILSNGSRPADIPAGCNVQGTNGYVVGGAGAAGSYAMNQVGNGTGKEIATVAGGILAMSAAQNAENNRIREECARQLASKQNTYMNPSNVGNPQMPQAEILYAVKNQQGLPMYVTVNDSPGLAALRGQGRGTNDPASDPIVSNALNKSLQHMQVAYEALNQEAIAYVSLTHGRDTAGKLSRYAVDANEIQAGAAQDNAMRQKIADENNKFQIAFNNYAGARSVFAQIADNAAVDGFNLSGYNRALDLMKTPDSVQVAYDGKLMNRWQTFDRNFANR